MKNKKEIKPLVSAAKFYDDVHLDYLNWSSQFNIHFGYFKMGMNPFDLESMLRQMNVEVAERMGISEGQQISNFTKNNAVSESKCGKNICKIEDGKKFENPHILDAGCGVGEGLFQLAEGHPNVRFTGINISQKQIAFGNEKLENLQLENHVKLLACDFQKTPFPTAHFDQAFAIESVCYAEAKDKSAFVSEMARVLKSGGKLIVADGFLRHPKPLPKWLGRLHKKNLLLWSISELADIQFFVEMLKSKGFEKIKVEDVSWNILPSALHLPFTAFKVWRREGFFMKKKKLTAAQKNYLKAIWLTLFLGMFRRHFGYYIVTAHRLNEPAQ